MVHSAGSDWVLLMVGQSSSSVWDREGVMGSWRETEKKKKQPKCIVAGGSLVTSKLPECSRVKTAWWTQRCHPQRKERRHLCAPRCRLGSVSGNPTGHEPIQGVTGPAHHAASLRLRSRDEGWAGWSWPSPWDPVNDPKPWKIWIFSLGEEGDWLSSGQLQKLKGE